MGWERSRGDGWTQVEWKRGDICACLHRLPCVFVLFIKILFCGGDVYARVWTVLLTIRPHGEVRRS